MTAVLLAGGIMLALAVVFGVILVIFSHVFSVEKDAKAQEIEGLLAKSNCGGCGKAAAHSLPRRS